MCVWKAFIHCRLDAAARHVLVARLRSSECVFFADISAGVCRLRRVLPCSLAGIASNLVAFEMRIGQLCVSLQCETPPDATARCVLVVRYRIVCS